MLPVMQVGRVRPGAPPEHDVLHPVGGGLGQARPTNNIGIHGGNGASKEGRRSSSAGPTSSRRYGRLGSLRHTSDNFAMHGGEGIDPWQAKEPQRIAAGGMARVEAPWPARPDNLRKHRHDETKDTALDGYPGLLML
ncbi:MAG: hypothetical protein FJ404_12830 [Verrucomicrobia bacterium]|nr:hypothetical protein [Verrucomicrobiota bacterium]